MAWLTHLLSAVLASTTPTHAASTTHWTVIVGGASADTSIYANAFFPQTIEIGVGDTVIWTFEGFHNVAFLRTAGRSAGLNGDVGDARHVRDPYGDVYERGGATAVRGAGAPIERRAQSVAQPKGAHSHEHHSVRRHGLRELRSAVPAGQPGETRIVIQPHVHEAGTVRVLVSGAC